MVILLRLADHADTESKCWPGNANLAAVCGVNEKTIERAKRKFLDLGLITVGRRPLPGGGRTTDVIYLEIETDNLSGSGSKPTSATSETDNHDPPKPTSATSHSIKEPSEEPSRESSSLSIEEADDLVTASGADPAVPRLCSLVAAHAQRASMRSTPPRVTKVWLQEMDRLIRIDGRTPEQIEWIIGWLETPGNFWGPNVLSAPKLRKQFDRLVADAARERAPQLKGEAQMDRLRRWAKEEAK
jgi:hypothetical protein